MKAITFSLSILTACILITTACKKKGTSDPEAKPASPGPYTYSADLQSSEDISFATMAISDMDMMCAQISENNFSNFFYYQKTPSSYTSAIVIRDSSIAQVVASFNNVACRDGKTRDGSIFYLYRYDANSNPNANPNATYYHDFGFVATVLPYGYVVDGWHITLFDSTKLAHITNKVSSSAYNPAQTNLTWEISGKFKLTNLSDASRNIVWDGKIIKTLTNTNDPTVFAADKKSPINWNLAKVNYAGSITGFTGGTVPFTYTIDNNNPLVRNFNCAFVPSGSTGVTHFHPFISGSATFATSNYDPRSINYGPNQDCDNKGTVSFHGETYNVDFE